MKSYTNVLETPKDIEIFNYINERITPGKLNAFSMSGMIGVGKTSTIQKMCEALSAQGLKVGVIYELHEDSPYSLFKEENTLDMSVDTLIKGYYSQIEFLKSDDLEIKGTALTMTLTHQAMFVANRSAKAILGINKAVRENYDVIIFDRTLYADRIFTKLNLDNGSTYMDTYHPIWLKWRNRFSSKLKEHNIKCYNIILEADTDTILKRIEKRGRAMEQNQDDYMKALHEKYVFDLKEMFIDDKLTFEIFDTSEEK